MATYNKSGEKRRILQDFRRHEEEVIGSLCRLSSRPVSPKSQMEQERRIRREIANSNERRRMQSINAGFQSLRTLLPHHEGEKLSKAAILQQTTQHIYQIEQEKNRLAVELTATRCQLKRLLNQQNQDSDGGSSSDSPLPKRKKCEAVEVPLPIEEVVVNLGSPNSGEPCAEELKREMIELRLQLERERRLRQSLEEQARSMESQLLYPERIREFAHQVHHHYQQSSVEERVMESEIHRASPPSPKCRRSDSPGCDSVPLSAVETTLVYVGSTTPPLSGQGENRLAMCQLRSMSVDDDVILEDDDDDSCPASPQTPRSASPQVVPSVPQVQQHQHHQETSNLYLNRSRQNLETIVEAIRHLEGDHMFNDDPAPRRTATIKVERQDSTEASQPSSLLAKVTVAPAEFGYRHHQVIQTRPGVIVSAHS